MIAENTDAQIEPAQVGETSTNSNQATLLAFGALVVLLGLVVLVIRRRKTA